MGKSEVTITNSEVRPTGSSWPPSVGGVHSSRCESGQVLCNKPRHLERCAETDPAIDKAELDDCGFKVHDLNWTLRERLEGSPDQLFDSSLSAAPPPQTESTSESDGVQQASLLTRVVELLVMVGGRGCTLGDMLDSSEWPKEVETNLNIMIGVGRTPGVTGNGTSSPNVIYSRAANAVLDEVSAMAQAGLKVAPKASPGDRRTAQATGEAEPDVLARMRNSDSTYEKVAAYAVTGAVVVAGVAWGLIGAALGEEPKKANKASIDTKDLL